jgi:cytosine/adenosine deaminase-related metal-dependent hydrolase
MAYRKFAADQLFDGYRLLEDKVLITTEDGRIEDIIATNEAGDDVEKFSGILTPGFINCHCHLELSHMKGLLPEKTGLVDFVFSVVTQRHFSETEILAAIEKAEDEMLQNGIVAVGDICNNTLTIPQKQKQRLAYYNFIEVSGWLPEVAEKRFNHSYEIFKAYEQQTKNQKPKTSLSPHAPYSVSDALWKLLQQHFAGKTITIHNQETAHEDELFQHGTGDFRRLYERMKINDSFFQRPSTSSLENSLPKLKDAKNIILVHNTYTTEADLHSSSNHQITKSSNLFWCFCPNANLYIENRLPDVKMFIDNNATIVLGTDSLASNWSLSILDEMKTISKNFPSIKTEQLLQWATSNGAKALQIEDQFGSFEKGKRPGVIQVEFDQSGTIQTSRKIL